MASPNDGPPWLPYAGTSGWSGSQTSRDRATYLDLTGITGKRQRHALRLLDAYGPEGLTWRELGAAMGVHHGGASGVLSVLHKCGRVARLAEVRDRCKVYVLPEHVQGRDTEPQGRRTDGQPEPE